MEPLSPKQAAHVADRVYEVRRLGTHQVATLGDFNPFAVGSAVRFEATAGLSAFKKGTEFGYVAKGPDREPILHRAEAIRCTENAFSAAIF